MSDIILGLNCGGSDPASGITANPATGIAVERIIDEGGSAILGETAEWIGAEHILMARAKTKAIARDTLRLVRRFERHVKAHGGNLSYGQPTRGNQAAVFRPSKRNHWVVSANLARALFARYWSTPKCPPERVPCSSIRLASM